MSKTIGSKEYNEWLNSPLTKALKRSFEQSITDPENQPSQYGTVTLAMYEHLEEQITASQQRVSELEKERECLTKDWFLLKADAASLKQQRDELVEAATMAVEMIEYDKHERRHVRWKLQDAIASVKEKA